MWSHSLSTLLQSPENKEIASSLIPLVVTSLFFCVGFILLCITALFRFLFPQEEIELSPSQATPSVPEGIQIVLNPGGRLRAYFQRFFYLGSQDSTHLVELDALNDRIQLLELECAKLREQNASLLSRLTTKDSEIRYLQENGASLDVVVANERLVKAQQRTHQVENQLSELIGFIDQLYQNRTEPEEIKKMRAGFRHHS